MKEALSLFDLCDQVIRDGLRSFSYRVIEKNTGIFDLLLSSFESVEGQDVLPKLFRSGLYLLNQPGHRHRLVLYGSDLLLSSLCSERLSQLFYGIFYLFRAWRKLICSLRPWR